MENLAVFSVKELKRAGAEEREKREMPLQNDSEIQSNRQSDAKELSENCRRKVVCWGRKKKQEQLESVGDQCPSPEAPPDAKEEGAKEMSEEE